MNGHRLEVADVFREYGSRFLDRYGSTLSIEQKRVFNAIMACRTPALGGHLYQCDHCATNCCCITRAATVTVPSARPWSEPNGWRPARPSCCQFRTFTW